MPNLFPHIMQGDSAAFDELFRRYYAAMVLYADSQIHNREESEDLVTELFYFIWQQRKKLADIRSEKNYLFILLRNRVIDYLRRQSRFREEELTDVFVEAPFDSALFEFELYAQLKEEVDKLPVKCAEVMRMKLDGLDDYEIAKKLNISYETVRSHTKRGISLLRKKFDKSILLFFFA